MTVLQVLILAVLLFVIPTWVGGIFSNVEKNRRNPVFMWISGQIVLWAGFQLLCVPIVLMERENGFAEVLLLFAGYTVLLLIGSTMILLRSRHSVELHVVEQKREIGRKEICLWIVFAMLLMFQFVQAVRLAYADGDDAFYVAMSNMAEESGVLYQKIPYTGAYSELDVRHGLAPFPVWIACLARVSGMRPVSVAHIALPIALLPMTYGIYYLLGSHLLAKKRELLPLFLLFTEILVLFGDYSFYTTETFMIARSRQGKAALGSIVIPMLIFLLLLLLEKLQEERKVSGAFWGLLVSTMLVGCLCSTLGALLVCMLIGMTGLCIAVCYKGWKLLLPMAACCIPCVIYAGMYLLLA